MRVLTAINRLSFLLNVAITRAKSKLIVLGNKRYIEENFSEGAAF